jgi:hypothetical protein
MGSWHMIIGNPSQGWGGDDGSEPPTVDMYYSTGRERAVGDVGPIPNSTIAVWFWYAPLP